MMFAVVISATLATRVLASQGPEGKKIVEESKQLFTPANGYPAPPTAKTKGLGSVIAKFYEIWPERFTDEAETAAKAAAAGWGGQLGGRQLARL